MGRKGKTQKHTAAEIAGKHKAAKEAAGGAGHGAKGAKARAEKMGKIQVKCRVCLALQPHLAGMRIHYENKHPKEKWEDSMYESDFGSAKQKAKTMADPARVVAGKAKPASGSEKDKKAGGKKKKKDDLSFLDNY